MSHKLKLVLFFVVSIVFIITGLRFYMEINRRANERIVLRIKDNLEFALTNPSRTFSLGVVQENPYSNDVFGRVMSTSGLWCKVQQGSDIQFEGFLTGRHQFTARKGVAGPIVITITLRENSVLFEKCYLVIGEPI